MKMRDKRACLTYFEARWALDNKRNDVDVQLCSHGILLLHWVEREREWAKRPATELGDGRHEGERRGTALWRMLLVVWWLFGDGK